MSGVKISSKDSRFQIVYQLDTHQRSSKSEMLSEAAVTSRKVVLTVFLALVLDLLGEYTDLSGMELTTTAFTIPLPLFPRLIGEMTTNLSDSVPALTAVQHGISTGKRTTARLRCRGCFIYPINGGHP